ncbi:MAG TPA: zinc ribbon domain-containing protein [Chloroflexota bacterium]|nr:zinc ribbon domain-containing protein [Chloroflexota bacterium]
MRASLGVAPATLGAETALLVDARGDGTQQARRPDLVTSDVIAAGPPLGVDGVVWPLGQAILASPRSAAAVAAGGIALVALVAVVGVSRRRRVGQHRAVSGAPPASSAPAPPRAGAPDAPSPPAATAEATGVCARCGNPVAADAHFCARCGSPVSPARCPACRAVLAADARFCSACGTAVASTPPAAVAPAPRRAARRISGVGVLTVVLLGLVVFGAIRAAPMLVPARTPAPAPPPPGPAAPPAPPVSTVVSPTPNVPAPTASPAAASIGVASSRPPGSVGAGPPRSPAATVTPATPSGRAATPSRVPEAPPAVSLTQECPFRNDFGYSLRYPAGWHTGEGELAALACSDFAPVPFSDPDRVAISFRFAVGPFADVLSVFAGQGDVLARGGTTVAGFRAVRLEVESTKASGAATRARIYAYVIDRRGTAIVAATASDYPGYDANKPVLDAMVASLRLQ